MLVDTLLAKQTVTAHRKPVIRRINDKGVLQLSRLLQRFENSTHLFIEIVP